ncbi:MAG TPA: hypothetical protein VKE49_03635 [Myxococcaceae bacterium]|nr:hypothetical protein [Myxococcaceae bacterium]
MIELILSRYSTRKSREALLFEAVHSAALIQPDLIALGSQTAERWQDIAATYRDLGILADARLPEGLIYEASGHRRIPAWARWGVLGISLAALVAWIGTLLHKWIRRRLETAHTKPRLSPDPKSVSGENCRRNAPEGRSHASNGAMCPHLPLVRGGPSDALEGTELVACGQR